MKKILLILAVSTLTYTLQAQYVPKEKREKKEKEEKEKIDETETKPKKVEDKTPSKPKQKKEKSLRDKLFFMPNLWLTFGDITVVDAALTVGYRVTESYHIGLGGGYIHQSERIFTNSPERIKQNVMLARVFNRLFVYEGAYLQAEYELMNISYGGFENFGQANPPSRTLHIPLLGVGYFYSMGGRFGADITVLYDLNYSDNFSVYNTPFRLRVGFVL